MTPGYRLLIYSLIFKIVTRYRHEFKSQELWTEIKFVLERFAEPLTNLFEVSSVVLVHFVAPIVMAVISTQMNNPNARNKP